VDNTVISFDEQKPSRMNAGGRFSHGFLKNKGVFRRRLTRTPLTTIFPSLEKSLVALTETSADKLFWQKRH